MQVALTLTPAEMLASLYRLRWCAVAAALLIVSIAQWLLKIDFAFAPLLGIILLIGAWNLLVGVRLNRGWNTTELEGFIHLGIDTIALSALLYWGGGSTSPFVSLYLIPIAIAAAALPRLYAWGVAIIAAGAYSALLFNTLPTSHADHGGFAMHVFGMWVTFILGGLLLMTFVAGMAGAVRRRDQSLAQAREQMLRNEQVTAVGALAAGAAHELSTPLSTMAMIVQELRDAELSPEEIEQDLATLEQQIALCSGQIDHLLGAAEQARGEDAPLQPLSHWTTTVLERWRLMRPEVQAELNLEAITHDPNVRLDDSVSQSLINLLNNAADASLANNAAVVRVSARCNDKQIDISIEDEGPGISESDRSRAGRLRFSTKPGGRGLGLVLSLVNLERIGGEVSLDTRASGGTRTRILLPLQPAEAG